MDIFKEEQFATMHLGHLGLIADKIDSLKLIELIDQRLPITPGCGSKVSHGERVAAMIFNGLGFIDSLSSLVRFRPRKVEHRVCSVNG